MILRIVKLSQVLVIDGERESEYTIATLEAENNEITGTLECPIGQLPSVRFPQIGDRFKVRRFEEAL